MVPSLTANPAKGMIASLGTGMQALSSSIRKKTAGRPQSPMSRGRPLDDDVDDGLHMGDSVPYRAPGGRTATAPGDQAGRAIRSPAAPGR